MSFNPDLSKQAEEVIFSRKASMVDHPVVTFNNSPVARTPCQKYLGLYLGEKLNFSHHIKEEISKTCKGIRVIRKLHHVFPRHSKFLSHLQGHILIIETSFMTNGIIRHLVTNLKLYSIMQH